jgi:hypothetical protein
MAQIDFSSVIQQEYGTITNKEEVTIIAQMTINNIRDFTRKSRISDLDKYTGCDENEVKQSTNTYLFHLLLCMFSQYIELL